ncbi:unnamed protein product [Menidia menidia]|uniref:(Atlantic silverside) hypothetical protein n=1 Tax=Menidia menidia TaxID=238744 RepID=A0A8S4AXT1_9TELE|nr:unnamed protein product [Menidia menidia]
MHKGQKNTGKAVFYKQSTGATVIRSGYLYKSPPQKRLKTEKSWKKRYFVLSKISQYEYQFRYFKGQEELDSPVGSIDMSQISLLYGNPQHHHKWGWVQKNFKCSSDCVIYIKAAERDYFLVGMTSTEMEAWLTDLQDAMKDRPHKNLSLEEISNGGTIEVISNPFMRKKNCSTEFEKRALPEEGRVSPNHAGKNTLRVPILKIRSMSDPSSHTLDIDPEKAKQDEECSRRRLSEPVNPIYDYPRSYLSIQKGEKSPVRTSSAELIYETMNTVKMIKPEAQPVDHEVSSLHSPNLTQTFDKKKILNSLPTCAEEADTNREDKCQSSDLSSSSSSSVEMLDSYVPLREEQGSTESIDRLTLLEKDIEVKPADLKKHLTLIDLDGKPSVSGWTGQPQTVCLFHKGDQILAINDLHTGSIEDFNMYISKSLKNEVKVTLLRQRGRQPLHLPNCPCTD